MKRTNKKPVSRWEHATIHFNAAQGWGVLNTMLDLMSAEYGGQLICILPAMIGSGIVVGGQEQRATIWNLIMRFPPDRSRPAIARLNGGPAREELPPAEDRAGAQALAMEDVSNDRRALQAAFARE